jgi:hypothetical protein
MLSKPKVSVCITSYNHGQFLPTALDSVLAQSYRDFEIVVVDDASTDNSLQVLESYATRHPAVRVYTHPDQGNHGISATANLAVKKARGEYIVWLGSDDVWYPDKLEQQIKLLESDSGLGLVYGRAHLIDEHGERCGPDCIGRKIDDPQKSVEDILQENPIPALTVVVRRACFDEAGLFDESLVYSDWEMWLRIAAHWRIGFQDAALGMYRIHGSNVSVGIKRETHLRYELAVLSALRQKAGSIGGSFAQNRVRAMLELESACRAFSLGELNTARQYLNASFTVDTSLQTDVASFFKWLAAKKHEPPDTLEPSAREQDFKMWVATNLPAMAGKSFIKQITRRVAAQQFAEAALQCFQTDSVQARRMPTRCLITDPRWLRDRRLLKLVIESWFGSGLMTQLRRSRKLLSP